MFVEIRAADQLNAAFDQIVRARAGALQVAEDSVLNGLRPRIAELAMKHNLPSMFASLGAAGEGLVSYGPSFAQLGRRVATLAAKILKGEKPANLPIEQPTDFVLTVNMKTAKALGISIPETVMVRATRVIE
jgi:putative ABC transport system substrate-binding protein